jgi:hypothetical protein
MEPYKSSTILALRETNEYLFTILIFSIMIKKSIVYYCRKKFMKNYKIYSLLICLLITSCAGSMWGSDNNPARVHYQQTILGAHEPALVMQRWMQAHQGIRELYQQVQQQNEQPNADANKDASDNIYDTSKN